VRAAAAPGPDRQLNLPEHSAARQASLPFNPRTACRPGPPAAGPGVGGTGSPGAAVSGCSVRSERHWLPILDRQCRRRLPAVGRQNWKFAIGRTQQRVVVGPVLSSAAATILVSLIFEIVNAAECCVGVFFSGFCWMKAWRTSQVWRSQFSQHRTF
jgi:hypothetical protein